MGVYGIRELIPFFYEGKNMKYFIADINEDDGNFKTYHTFIFRAKNKRSAYKIHQYIVGTWYSEEHMQFDFSYESFCAEFSDTGVTKFINEGRRTEIDKHTFDQIKKHFSTDLTPTSFEAVESWLDRHLRYKKAWLKTDHGND